ncbi:unnamed protein product [Hydatigera taeniaeformis]|uniref:Dynein heavy chain tail domain-containing protein n=1 Tax=Hydatigena taeniaeformis TaxID=6205 RepID=A0A3P7HLF8_HYDTA|nr:unnamed protein product [Hydatigera taeniaeformis]
MHSSSKAFRVLQRLLENHPRKEIAQLFEERYTDILDRYDKELRLIETTFTEGSRDSGHFAAVLGPHYLPPVSSAIYWVRNLQVRITSPMLKMLNIRRLMESDRGKEVQDHYLCLVKRMTCFEEGLFNGKFNFEVDFGNELVQIMEETKFLQLLGFPVPDMACCVALREKELLRQRNELSDLAEVVRTTLGHLSMVEVATLEDHIVKLRATLAPAWKQLNWTSLIIDSYLTKANETFDHFCSVYLQQMADARMRDFEELARKHTEISTLLLNLERTITDKAATGREPKMVYLYEYWERRCFDTVHQMLAENLRRYLDTLQFPTQTLFGVDLMLSGCEVVSSPQPTEFYQHLIQTYNPLPSRPTDFFRLSDHRLQEEEMDT